MSHKIRLGNGDYALIDPEDYIYLSQWKWQRTGRYAASLTYVRGSGRKHQKQIRIFMHRLLNKTPNGLFTDHINGNGLDNRKSNLRTVTKSQNNRNQRKRPGTSQYKGAYWDKQMSMWRSRIRYSNSKLIGLFKNERHAAMAYDIWAKELYGEYAHLNFQPMKGQNCVY